MTSRLQLQEKAALVACYGMYVPLMQGTCTLQFFLEDILGLSPQYIDTHIQTILVQGLTADSLHVPLPYEARIGLSAAMPGVLGAILRRDGHYAPMRQDITLSATREPVSTTEAFWVELRCYNAIAYDQGLYLIQRGLALPKSSIGQELTPFAIPLPTHLPPAPRRDLVWVKLPVYL